MENNLFRPVQIDVEGFNVQQGGYLGWFCQLVVHVVGNREDRSSMETLWLKHQDGTKFKRDWHSFGYARFTCDVIKNLLVVLVVQASVSPGKQVALDSCLESCGSDH